MQTQTQPRALPSIPQVLATCKQYLTPAVVQGLVTATGVSFYERVYTPLIVMWCFMFQRLNPDHSLDAVVSHIASGAADHLDSRHDKPVSERAKSQSTAAYSKARKRMPLAVLQGMACYFARVAEERLDPGQYWHGHRVALLDGATLRLRPEGDLAGHYGQARNQHGSAYWVIMRVVVVFSLGTAALLAAAEGPHLAGEQSLAKKVLAQLARLSIGIGDRNFGVFSIAQAARHDDLFVLLRMTKARVKAVTKQKLHSFDDLLMQWTPSKDDQCDPTMSMAPITGRMIYVHLEPEGYRPIDLYLFTTLLDAYRYPLQELVELYGQRWHVELDLRYVKTTLDMNFLTAKSVQMARKELWAGLAAYNIVRLYMVMAAREAALSPLDLSFSKCRQRVLQVLCSLQPTDLPEDLERRHRDLLTKLAQCRLQKRARYRVEPRAYRKCVIQYAVLRGSRHQARQRELKRRVELNKC